jgi:hypothetical protein
MTDEQLAEKLIRMAWALEHFDDDLCAVLREAARRIAPQPSPAPYELPWKPL